VARRPRDLSWPPAPEPLEVPVVDDHTHLDTIADALADGVPAPTIAEHLANAAAVGVDRVVQIGCDLPTARETARLVGEHRGGQGRAAMVGGVAVHPNEAPLHAGVREVAPDGLAPQPREHHAVPLDEAIAEIADLARDNDRIRVIGETGLDRFRTGERGYAAQVASFRAHVALAKELGLPLQIHDRDAHTEVLDVLARDGAPEVTVFHCFSGDAEMARECVVNGWYLSFAGPITFRANDELRFALSETPRSRVLVETDAPFLTPHPYRGRPAAPYLIPVTLRAMAQVRGEAVGELAAAVSATAEAIYGPW